MLEGGRQAACPILDFATRAVTGALDVVKMAAALPPISRRLLRRDHVDDVNARLLAKFAIR